jgi:hypothetical protein
MNHLGVMGTPGVGFFSLIIIGGFAGWIAGMITGHRAMESSPTS